jgi:hypothetical protein
VTLVKIAHNLNRLLRCNRHLRRRHRLPISARSRGTRREAEGEDAAGAQPAHVPAGQVSAAARSLNYAQALRPSAWRSRPERMAILAGDAYLYREEMDITRHR